MIKQGMHDESHMNQKDHKSRKLTNKQKNKKRPSNKQTNESNHHVSTTNSHEWKTLPFVSIKYAHKKKKKTEQTGCVTLKYSWQTCLEAMIPSSGRSRTGIRAVTGKGRDSVIQYTAITPNTKLHLDSWKDHGGNKDRHRDNDRDTTSGFIKLSSFLKQSCSWNPERLTTNHSLKKKI